MSNIHSLKSMSHFALSEITCTHALTHFGEAAEERVLTAIKARTLFHQTLRMGGGGTHFISIKICSVILKAKKLLMHGMLISGVMVAD